MSKQDYYEILGVPREAGAEDLKRAYRKLAMQCHPDRNPGDKAAEHKFKDISEAYDVLKDDQKRAAYDRFGHAAFEGGAGRGGNGFEFNFGSGFADIFDEMFGEFMGQRRGQGGNRGADLRYNLEITLEDSFRGKSATIPIATSQSCVTCAGSGAAPGTKPVDCTTCRGIGKVRAQQGFFTIERTCPTCHGAGKVIEQPCQTCAGSGRTRKEKTLSVTIPPGVEDGTRIRLAGEGEAGMRGGTAGDLYIFLTIQPHGMFRREGADIYCRVPLPLTIAALGGEIEIPTIDGGPINMTIPGGTQSGHQFRLRNKGMSVMRSRQRGDMYVEAVVETPVNLNKRQQELLREFERESETTHTNPMSTGFFTKVRELWGEMRD